MSLVIFRVVSFALYSVGFFSLMYLVNQLIDDKPSRVRTRLLRHEHLIKEYLDGERRLAKRSAGLTPDVHRRD